MNALLNISLPVFGLIFCGYLSAKFRILGPQSSEALNSFVYYFALPALLFIFVARAPVERIFYLPFLAAWGGGLTITFILMLIVSRSVVFVPLIIILLEIEKRGETEPVAILRGVAEAVVTVIVAAPPTGATCFVLAQRYGVFVARTSSVTLASTF